MLQYKISYMKSMQSIKPFNRFKRKGYSPFLPDMMRNNADQATEAVAVNRVFETGIYETMVVASERESPQYPAQYMEIVTII